MKESLKLLFQKAQNGNNEAMLEIINRFQPLINKEVKSVNKKHHEDLEQHIKELIIKKVYSYNMKKLD